MSTPILSASEYEKSLYHNHLSGMSSWESDACDSNIFKDFSVNMVSTSHPEDEHEEIIEVDIDLCIKHLNNLWDIHFEQRKVTQINLRDEANPKPIFVSESLSPPRRKI